MTVPSAPAPFSDEFERGSVAVKLGNEYRKMVDFHRHQLGMSLEEADRRVLGTDMAPEQTASELNRIRNGPPEHISWSDLARLADCDPEELVAVWDNLKAAARDELASGHRAAQALDWQRRPFARARYLAIRESFLLGTTMPSGIEAALMDLAAEAYSDYLEMSEQLHRMMSAEAEVERDDLERDGRWRPPHETVATAIERTARLAERAHKRFLQTIKSLHELQRQSPSLYVAQAGQVNVGQQQVNLAGGTTAAEAPDTDLSK